MYRGDAYGGSVFINSSGIGGNAAQLNPIRYKGYYYDAETGFYYLQSRYYDPSICRFINADTYCDTGTGTTLSTNMFAYCENDPVNYADSDGRSSKTTHTYVIYYDGKRSLKIQAKNSFYRFISPIYKAVRTKNDFIRVWNSMANVIDIYLYLHGDTNELHFSDGFIKYFRELKHVNVSGRIYLFSCRGGKKDINGDTVAWKLSLLTGAKVHACAGGVSYINNFGYYLARSAIKASHEYGAWYVFYYKKGKKVSYYSSAMGV